MSCVYGPVPSRRLGASLGIDVVPSRICSYDCIYCQLGRTKRKVSDWKELDYKSFPKENQILKGVQKAEKNYDNIDYLTLSGSGEPTLNPKLGSLVSRLRETTNLPLSIITNSSLLSQQEVLRAAEKFDLALPSLDAGSQRVFQQINRPAEVIELDEILAGIGHLCKSSVTVWLEVMLLKSNRFITNCSPQALTDLARKIDSISPTEVHLNTCVRPPAEKVDPLEEGEMKKAKQILQDHLRSELTIKIVAKRTESGSTLKEKKEAEAEIRNLLTVRPCTTEDIADSTGLNSSEVGKHLQRLIEEGKVKVERSKDQTFYLLSKDSGPGAT